MKIVVDNLEKFKALITRYGHNPTLRIYSIQDNTLIAIAQTPKNTIILKCEPKKEIVKWLEDNLSLIHI